MSEKRIRVGILMGGPSREREISFAGGRTVYDNLNKALFEPVPIFVDSLEQMILLDWQYIYKGTIRDFYPPVSVTPPSEHNFQVYIESLKQLRSVELQSIAEHVGTPIEMSELSEHIDIAFTTLHGRYGEDGRLQARLQSYGIPFTGSGMLPSSIGISKAIQKKWMEKAGFDVPAYMTLDRAGWDRINRNHYYSQVLDTVGNHLVVRPSHQGSSIGVQILNNPSSTEFNKALDKAFFIEHLSRDQWSGYSEIERIEWIKESTDIKAGLGYPILINERTFYHPEELLSALNSWDFEDQEIKLEAVDSESLVVIESFIDGREFSCIVMRNTVNKIIALPPTEIIKQSEVYDYRSKYLPGLSKKKTPIDLPIGEIKNIQTACKELFDFFEFNCYARIDGFIQADGTIYLNDPNTTSGMLPSSFFFHQAAEIGLSPGEFIHYIIRSSLIEHNSLSTILRPYQDLIDRLDTLMDATQKDSNSIKKIAVILGGYSFERHISVESGRNIYEKLSAHKEYLPTPLFLKKETDGFSLHELPIHLLLKDNADDIAQRIEEYNKAPDRYAHPIIKDIQDEAQDIMKTYVQGDALLVPKEISFAEIKERFDGVFIGLHGRPGEDGTLQSELDKYEIPYNGSRPESAKITIDKYETLKRLRAEGFKTAQQLLLNQNDFNSLEEMVYHAEKELTHPFIAKPVDDGCSSAVKIIKSSDELHHYLETLFRQKEEISALLKAALSLEDDDEFPRKNQVLLEELITRRDAKHFLEITGGLYTELDDNGERIYNMLEPSETLSSGEILSLEEKFLAGQGQNLTPARYDSNPDLSTKISKMVRADLERAARILHVDGYARIDAFIRIYDENTIETIVIEVNSLPGMTPATCIFHQAALDDLKPDQFIDKILRYSFARQSLRTINT